MSIVARIRSALADRVQLVLIVLLSAAILHILATFAAPMMATMTPYARLAALAPLHAFAVLPPVTPQTQPLPFFGADARYALCRFDTGIGKVDIAAQLPGRGWSLSLYGREGDNVYTAVGQDAQRTEIALQLTPVTDRFLGLTPEAQGRPSQAVPQTTLQIPVGRGVVVLRAPDRGIAYRRDTEAALRQARCVVRPY